MDRFEKIIRDPVHNLIRFDDAEGEAAMAIIARPEFQRLRRIRQLGLSYLVYPGAEHSRFQHSLGVWWTARRMIEALERAHPPGDKQGDELREHRAAVLAAALLHDVGHGPFSHVFERSLRPDSPPGDYPKDHEDWSVRIIREQFAETLSEHGVDVDDVCAIIQKSPSVPPICSEIVSSQLDADRSDYLLRDGLMTGTIYGRFDLEWMLRSLRIDSNGRICLEQDRAEFTVEQYAVARRFMYMQVYTHHAVRAYESMLSCGLRAMAANLAGDEPRALAFCGGHAPLAHLLAARPLTVSQYLDLDDWQILSRLGTLHVDTFDDGADEILRYGTALLGRIRSRGPRFRHIPLSADKETEAAVKLEILTEAKHNGGRFAMKRDVFDNLIYKSILYRKHKEPEERDEAIRLLARNGDTILAETAQDGLLNLLKDTRKRVARLYYDDTNVRMMDLLREHKLI